MGFLEAQLIDHNRPMLLKDFLRDDGGSNRSRSTVSSKKKAHIVLLRSWSKRAAAKKMSAVHKVIKLLQFASPRKSLTKSGSGEYEGKNDIFGDALVVQVKVKDILRWRSFRDIVDDDPTPPLDAAAPTSFNNKGDWSSFEEYEQQSPVSVLDSPFRQVEEFTSPYHPSLATVQREKRNVEREIGICDDATEERAMQLLRHLKEEEDDHIDIDIDIDSVILDFFVDEINSKLNDDDEMLRIAKSWKDGELEELYDEEMSMNRELFVKEMERGICWNKLKEEQRELCHQLELTLFNDLIDHLLADFLAN